MSSKLVAILGSSGDGKTTSTIINPDGTFDMNNYQGMNPESHFIINLDRKALPIPAGMWDVEHKNYKEIDNFDDIKKALAWAAQNSKIKSIAIDTINVYLAMKEFNDRRKMTFDQWKDYANDVIELNMLCNQLRDDQIVYIMGHTMLQTQPDGTEKTVFSVSGKKLTKTQPEGFYPIVLMTRVDYGTDGNNKYFFQTKANHSSAKAPLGMFDKFKTVWNLKLIKHSKRGFGTAVISFSLEIILILPIITIFYSSHKNNRIKSFWLSSSKFLTDNTKYSLFCTIRLSL